MKLTAGICTLGCKVNFYESECIANMLSERGVIIRPFEEKCDVYIINSCTVTGESDRKVAQMCRRAVKNNPDAFVCVTGCMAQVNAGQLSEIGGIDYICGNRNKSSVVDRIIAFAAEKKKNASAELNVPEFEPSPPYEPLHLGATSHTRAVIKIEDGCDSNCSYCIIHTARGPARSRCRDEILDEAAGLAKAGYKEVVLTGIELSSYAGDIADLAAGISEIDGIERIRLGSLDPYYLTKQRIDRLAEVPALMPHFHISLQSGSSAVLAGMRRKYNSDMALERIVYLKEKFPAACLFADIIVGFPGEKEHDFRKTVDFIRNVEFLHLHIFPYSRRKGTEAAAMSGQLSSSEKRSRAAELAAIQREIKRGILERVVEDGRAGRTLRVLFENDEEGHSEEFIDVSVAHGEEKSCRSGNERQKNASGKAARGEILDVRPEYTDGNVIFGNILH